MKWKCLDSQSLCDNCLKDYSVCEWFHRTDFIHPITWGHYLILWFFSFLPQGQNHIYASGVVSRRRLFHAHSVFPQSIPNPISKSSSKMLPSINRTHVSPQSYKGVTNSLCLLVWDEISLFHTRQTFITIPSASTPTPPPCFILHCHLCQFGMRKPD